MTFSFLHAVVRGEKIRKEYAVLQQRHRAAIVIQRHIKSTICGKKYKDMHQASIILQSGKLKFCSWIVSLVLWSKIFCSSECLSSEFANTISGWVPGCYAPGGFSQHLRDCLHFLYVQTEPVLLSLLQIRRFSVNYSYLCYAAIIRGWVVRRFSGDAGLLKSGATKVPIQSSLSLISFLTNILMLISPGSIFVVLLNTARCMLLNFRNIFPYHCTGLGSFNHFSIEHFLFPTLNHLVCLVFLS